MSAESAEGSDVLRRALGGDQAAVAAVFDAHCDRLRRMVRLRLDHRLQGRIDPSDVIQDAYFDVRRRFSEYSQYESMPVFLWLRLVTAQRLVDLHRYHLGAKVRDAGREVSLHGGPLPEASSVSLAAQLLGEITTASSAAIKAETKAHVQRALNSMDHLDREVLTLRHFEHLTNAEVARELSIKPNAASNRYVRAVKRLREILADIPGINGSLG